MWDPWDEGLPEDDNDDEDRRPAKRPRGECTPDLALGVLLSDLLKGDNPENPNPTPVLVRLNSERVVLLRGKN